MHMHTVGKRSIITVGTDTDNKIFKWVTDVQPRLKLTWNTILLCGWVSGPSEGNSCNKHKNWLKNQLDLGNTVPSTSPWNTPIFVIL